MKAVHLLSALLLASPTAAGAETMGTVGAWTILKDEANKGCLMGASYGGDARVTLTVAHYPADDDVVLTVMNSAWSSVTETRIVHVSIDFGGVAALDGDAALSPMAEGEPGVTIRTGRGTLDHIAKAPMLTLETDVGPAGPIPLGQGKAAVEKLLECSKGLDISPF